MLFIKVCTDRVGGWAFKAVIRWLALLASFAGQRNRMKAVRS